MNIEVFESYVTSLRKLADELKDERLGLLVQMMEAELDMWKNELKKPLEIRY